nr:hypothetical protein [Saprospiraceae bacterium]
MQNKCLFAHTLVQLACESVLQKPEKIYLDNTNLLFALSDGNPDIGTIREVFVNNQLREVHKIQIPKKGDFIVDNSIARIIHEGFVVKGWIPIEMGA